MTDLESEVQNLRADIGQIWSTLAYLLVNKDDALLAHSILMGLNKQGMQINSEAIKRLEEIAAKGPKPTSI